MLQANSPPLLGQGSGDRSAPPAGEKQVRRAVHAKYFGLAPFAFFLLLLALFPFWYGAKPAWPRMVFGFGLCVVVGLMLAQHVVSGTGFALPFRQVTIPLWCFWVVVIWALIQSCVPTAGVASDQVWGVVAEGLLIAPVGTISSAPADTLLAVTTLFIHMAVFLVALQFGADPLRAITALQFFSVVTVAYALWGMLDHFMGWHMVLFVSKNLFSVDSLGGYVSSTFLNADHFADFLLVGLAATLALGIRDARRMREAASMGQSEAAVFLPTLRNIAALVILAAALWLTRSRAGFACGLVCIVTLAAILGIRLKLAGKSRWVFAVGAVAALSVALIVVLALNTSIGQARADRLADGFATRQAIFSAVLRAISDNWLLGTGFGAFRDAFAVYHTSELGVGAYMNAAHNVYLEAIFGLGLPIALVLFAGVGWIVWRILTGALLRRQHVAAPIAASIAAIAVLTHGLVEFGLQTPGVAAMFVALMGFGCAQSWSSRQN